jgi:hypothetical protein
LEWRNIKTITSQAADESLEKFAHKNIKNLRRWNKINCKSENFGTQEESSKKIIDNETE